MAKWTSNLPAGFKSVVETLKVHFPSLFFGMKRTKTKGLEGGSRFAGAKRFALRQLDNDKLDGKGGN